MIGFRVGYSRYQLRGSEVDFRAPMGIMNAAVNGFTASLLVRGQLYRRLALQGEMVYVCKGGYLNSAGIGKDDSYIVDYLQIPLVLNLAVAKLHQLSLHLEAGYAASLAMSGPEINKQSYAIGNDFEDKGVVFAPVGGAEVAWNQPKRSYFLHFRYSQDPDAFYRRTFQNQQYALRHSGFSITAGALFGVR